MLIFYIKLIQQLEIKTGNNGKKVQIWITFVLNFLFRWAHFAAGAALGKASLGNYPRWPVIGVQNLSICHTFLMHCYTLFVTSHFFPSGIRKVGQNLPLILFMQDSWKFTLICSLLMGNFESLKFGLHFKHFEQSNNA